MTSHKDAANEKIHDIANAAKAKVERVIDSTVEAVSGAVDVASQHVHDAGKKVIAAGERIVKASE